MAIVDQFTVRNVNVDHTFVRVGTTSQDEGRFSNATTASLPATIEDSFVLRTRVVNKGKSPSTARRTHNILRKISNVDYVGTVSEATCSFAVTLPPGGIISDAIVGRLIGDVIAFVTQLHNADNDEPLLMLQAISPKYTRALRMLES